MNLVRAGMDAKKAFLPVINNTYHNKPFYDDYTSTCTSDMIDIKLN
jgi:hypothetical protein